MSDAKVVFAGDAASLLAEHKKIEEAKTKEIAGLKALLAESKKTYSEEQKHLREKQTALDKTRNAQQVYNDQMQKWFNLMASGKITLAEFNRLKGVETKALNDSTEATKKAQLAQSNLGKETASSTNSMVSMVGSFVSVTAILGTATAALRAFAEEERRMQKESMGVVLTIDELSRDYAVQAGLKTEDQREASVTKIMETAKANAVTPAVAFETASQLASSGFKDVEGESLDTALKIIKTSDVRKGSPKEYIEGAARYLESFGMEMSADNLKDIGVAMRGIVDTPVQASDLAEFAEAAPELKRRGVDWKTGLAMMTELRKEYSGATSGTKMRNITQRLGQMKDDTKAMEALDVLGLKPQEVDAMGDGESMPLALGRINAALNNQPKADHSLLLGKLFNNENSGPAGELMSRLTGVDKNMKAFEDRSVFDAGVKFQMGGAGAANERGNVGLQLELMKGEDSVTNKMLTDKFEEIEYTRAWKEAGTRPGGRVTQMGLQLGRFRNYIAESIAGENESPNNLENIERQAKSWGVPFIDSDRQQLERFREFKADSLGQQADPQMERQNQLLENIAGNQQRQADAVTNPANRPTVNPNAAGRPDK